MSCDILTFPAVETSVRGGGGRLFAVFILKMPTVKEMTMIAFTCRERL